MNRVALLFFLTCFTVLVGCDKDDDASSDGAFYDNALRSASSGQLAGRWSIYQVEFEGEVLDAPANYAECGRDFIDFQPNGAYRDYVFDDNFECTPEIQMLSWSLANGVVTLTNGVEREDLVITELTASRLVFKLRVDADGDGRLDIVKAICNRYEPPMELDIYSGSFYWDTTVPNTDKILLKWDAYRGYNTFERYEIYRLDATCNVANATLIATITDGSQDFFVDESPEAFETLCYVFKIYTNEGLLGESDPVTVDPSYLEVPPVQLAPPVLSGTTVQLTWEPYEGYYFSHYEVEVRNYASGGGGGYQEEPLTVINTIGTTSYTADLPYFTNPVFVIYAYNIFGRRTSYASEGVNQRSTTYERPGILPVSSIQYYDFSRTATLVYFTDNSILYRYNYATRTVESTTELNSSSIDFIKIFTSSFGTEVIVNIGGTLHVYDGNLNFKYELQVPNIFAFTPKHLALSSGGYWLITDRAQLYSFSRTDSTLNLINTNTLYNQNFSSGGINVMDIGQNRILAGHRTQSQGLIVGINASGQLSSTSEAVTLNATSDFKNNSLFSEAQQYVLNVEDRTLYSTSTYNLFATLDADFFPSGISTNGSLILGTNNHPRPMEGTFQEKKVRTLTYPGLTEQVYSSVGYPQVVFQNHLGQIVSISKALVGRLDGYSPENDIFIEVIE